ncbi:Rne/Rng family ribonuclease [Candidatus Trichorickettsia mobilis]|uniref:Ribonuclease G n=1 Tax=Candidatus Trichorickettsia mobilis TaxID=1346319 RepID=A0ABZ0UV01_9RICK|nr:Rne/Rng family ribonuclease [Candidatus Trichorickettsia mobilis]WPY00744.1 Rne/Rng family ribonuclease [Candidatus Trichorickettsia mobilis]
MSKKIIIDAAFPNETRVVLLSSNNNIEDIEYENAIRPQNKGNIYLAKITRIEPSLQAAFIDYGNEKSGFLPFSEIHPDYYHISVADQKSLSANLKEITPPKITTEDAEEIAVSNVYNILVDNDEIDISTIEKLVDDKLSTTFDLEVSDIDIETIPPDKEIANSYKQYKIQEVIKKGQILLVQLVKEERGNKGASLTTYISFAGKYCVLMPNKSSQNGVSRKISNSDERKRLKNIISQLATENNNESSSVIIRTAGIGRTTLEIKRDYNYLVKLWNKIREVTLKSIAPCFIHQEEGIIQKTIRDMFDHNVKELMVQGGNAYQSAIKFMRDILPTEISRVKEYKNKTPIFTKFAVEDQLSNLYQPIVALQSGGYVVINPTEALISIDVNSGRATSERNIEETALKTNLEAAKEIARQIRLRDLSGLLVIDFIDMYELRHRKIVERSLKEFLSRDRARIQTSNISTFGLLEMSRQRLRPSFLELNATICSHCNGKGLVRAGESNAMLILRTVENEIFHDSVDTVNVYASNNAIIYLLNNQRQEIAFIEAKYGIKLNFYLDPTATSDSYSVEKIKAVKKFSNVNVQNKPALQDISGIYQEKAANTNNSRHKQKWKESTVVSEKPVDDQVNDEDNIATATNITSVLDNGELNNPNVTTTDNGELSTPVTPSRRKRIRKKINYVIKKDI